jgi:hypothetical protein
MSLLKRRDRRELLLLAFRATALLLYLDIGPGLAAAVAT